MRLCWIENEGAWRDSTLEKFKTQGLQVYTLKTDWFFNSLEILVNKVIAEFSATDIFVINLNFVLSGYSQTEHLGVRLLKYLRLRGFNGHCVVYSFLIREQLMESDPKNLILFSGGISYYRLPYDLTSIPFENLTELKSPEDLSPYFKAEFSLPDNRHFMANWWGVLQLWKIQKAVERINGKSNLEKIEPLFKHALKEMYSYEGLVACHIKKAGEFHIDRELKRLLKEKEENFSSEERTRNEIKYETNCLKEEIEILHIQLETLKEVESESQEGIWAKIKLKLKVLPNPLRNEIEKLISNSEQLQNQVNKQTDYLKLIDLIKREKELIYEKQRLAFRRINRNIAELENSLSFSSTRFSLHAIREKLKNGNPRIVFVDDQAEEGWSSVFQRIIYGTENENFVTIVPGDIETNEKIAIRIQETIKKHRADLLILDLRLKGETGNITDPEQISGVQVLQKLNESKIKCPVLVTTASNKMRFYKKTINTGAIAFWVKEGLDESYKTENTIENYLRFVDLVYTLCFSKEIRFLYREFLSGILELEKNRTVYWWESKFWEGKNIKYPKSGTVSKIQILDVLHHTYEQFEEFIKMKIQQTLNPGFSSTIASLIIVQSARVFEIIHKTNDSMPDVTLKTKMADQLDEEKFKTISNYVNFRNLATHELSADYQKVESFLRQLLIYLNNETIEDYEKYEIKLNHPMDGAVYESIVESQHSKKKNNYFLKNPGLDLESRTNILLNLDYNNSITKTFLAIGDKIRFTLKIKQKSGVWDYYANNATLIES
jgi:CheY-like chemotaxis protein